MSLAVRQRQFVEAVQDFFGATKATRTSKLFGVSNSAKIIEAGIQLGVPNLDSAREENDAFILACVMKFPPEDEVYFAVLVRSGRAVFLARLAEMKSVGAAAKAAGDSETEAEEEGTEERGPAIRYSARAQQLGAGLHRHRWPPLYAQRRLLGQPGI